MFTTWHFLRQLWTILYFKSSQVRIGRNVSLLGYAYNIVVGKDITLYNNCIFELGSDSHLLLGNHIIFSYGCILSVRKSLQIGNNVQIGEYSSIRDTTHDYTDYGFPMMKNKDISSSIVIGNDVWIGRNCLILPGAQIGDGAVIGANSIIKGFVKGGAVYGGSPLREIKSRKNIALDL